MNSLMPPIGHVKIEYKNKELLKLADWDYLRVGLDTSGVANFDVKHRSSHSGIPKDLAQ